MEVTFFEVGHFLSYFDNVMQRVTINNIFWLLEQLNTTFSTLMLISQTIDAPYFAIWTADDMTQLYFLLYMFSLLFHLSGEHTKNFLEERKKIGRAHV